MRAVWVIAVAFGLWGALDAQTGEEAVEVPFRFDHNEILVQVRIGRHEPVLMMLDTNTDPSTVHLSFAQSREFKLREVHGEITGGGSDRPKFYLTRLERVELGSLPARDLQAVAIDLSQIQSRLGIQVQGVLGNNFLAGRVVQIDYPAKVLRFYRSSSALPIAKTGQSVFPFRYGSDGNLVIDGVAINGRKVRATLDTGSDGTFALTPTAVEALGLTEAASHGRAETSVGYKGAAQHTRGNVDRIALGPIEVASPEVVFWGKGGGRDQRPWELSIGNAFLKDYVVTLDYTKKRIVLQKSVMAARSE